MARNLLNEAGIQYNQPTRNLLDESQIYYQPQKQEKMGLGGVASDIYNKGIETIQGIPDALRGLAAEVPGAANQIFHEPGRAALNVASGFPELGHNVLNKPGDLRDYLVKKGLFPKESPSFRLPESILPKEYNYAESLGVKGNKPGDKLLQSIPTQVALSPAGESIPALLEKFPGLTSKGIVNQISRKKTSLKNEARTEYGELFNDATKKGIGIVPPPAINAKEIIKNSTPIYHRSLEQYLNHPSLENAHWAQSELGGFLRHLDSINKKTGLTPTQNRTYKIASKAQQDIKQAMFSKNRFGAHPELAERYTNLSNKYRGKVVPYTRLEDISQYESGKLKASSAINGLRNDDQFMIELSHRYPGLFLHSPLVKNVTKGLGYGVLGKLGFTGVGSLLDNK